MRLYDRYVLPRIVHYTCSTNSLTRQRMKIVPLAEGRVLEVGIGSGLNFPFYDAAKVTRVWGLDPSRELVGVATEEAKAVPFDVEFMYGGAEDIPLESRSVDTVVMTYSLCSIPQSVPSLREMARVLKEGGRLLFCEHGLAPDASVRRWQRWINPVWRRLGGGCHLNRDIPALIEEAGFRIEGMETMYLPGWRWANFNYWGSAVPR
ncbi:MAG: class I SAM-dependent methyltransferase [Gemmatimonadetes bacterium]|nr:class I SAM-dependent methyltransferase [Gemmatimonadota bacterium]